MTRALVSVVLPAHDAAGTIADAVTSVLGQTLADLELVVVDDGSTDGTGAQLAAFADPRLVVERHPTNRGLTAALQTGIARASAPVIARMDADDVAYEDRLARQYALLVARPAVGLVATGFVAVDADGREATHGVPPDHAAAWFRLLFSNCLAHPTTMFRRTVYEATGGYRADHFLAEDHDLWLRMAELTEIATIPDPLLRYRRTGTAMSVRDHDAMDRASLAVSRDALARVVHRSPPERVLRGLRDDRPHLGPRDTVAAASVLVAASLAVRRRCRSRRIPTDALAGQLKSMLARLRR